MIESSLSRREFMRRGAGAALVLPFIVGGCEKRMTPAAAAKSDVPPRVLTGGEAADLALLGELLVPGSRAAGLVQYIDHQLGAPADENMLMIKYLGLPAPYTDFYRGGLASIAGAARRKHDAAFTALSTGQRKSLVDDFVACRITGWQGAPASLFYFVVRSDAIDVVYGTEQGFALLGVPYMAHIAPPSNWGA